MPQEELATAFAGSTKVITEARTDESWQQFQPLRQVDLSPGPQGLTATASGPDPALLFPPFAAGQKNVLQVVINSPADTRAQLFYLTRGETAYAEGRSQMVNLTAGKNVVYFRLDQPDLVDPLRFDPGTAPGQYVIESVVARAIP